MLEVYTVSEQALSAAQQQQRDCLSSVFCPRFGTCTQTQSERSLQRREMSPWTCQECRSTQSGAVLTRHICKIWSTCCCHGLQTALDSALSRYPPGPWLNPAYSYYCKLIASWLHVSQATEDRINVAIYLANLTILRDPVNPRLEVSDI